MIDHNKFIKNLDLLNPIQRFKMTPEEILNLKRFRQSISKHAKQKFYEIDPSWFLADHNISWIMNTHPSWYYFWWKPEKYPIARYGHLLCKLPIDIFDKWWDPEQFNWKNCGASLIFYQCSNFDKWWDPNKFNWKMHSGSLISIRNFDKWWDPDKFNWKCVDTLIYQKSISLDKWWDPDKISNEHYNRLVPKFIKNDRNFDLWFDKSRIEWTYSICETFIIHSNCSFNKNEIVDHFDKWWDSDIFWKYKGLWSKYSFIFAKVFPQHFNKWFKKDLFNYSENVVYIQMHNKRKKNVYIGRKYLISNCSEYFDVWWDKQRIRGNAENFSLLEQYCPTKSDNWQKELIIYELSNEIDREEGII